MRMTRSPVEATRPTTETTTMATTVTIIRTIKIKSLTTTTTDPAEATITTYIEAIITTQAETMTMTTTTTEISAGDERTTKGKVTVIAHWSRLLRRTIEGPSMSLRTEELGRPLVFQI